MDFLKWEWTGAQTSLDEAYAHVGKGWRDLIQFCFEDLEALGWDGTITQVKEKFGGLRLYCKFNGIPENLQRVASIIEMHYENKSLHACEKCGKSYVIEDDKMYATTQVSGGCSGGWLKTLCKPHAEEWQNINVEDWKGQDEWFKT